MRKLVDRWDGWLVEYLNGEEGQQMRDIASGLLTVPLQVTSYLLILSYLSIANLLSINLYQAIY